MLFVLSRILIVGLLIVDWMEDTHCGSYLFSTPLSSTAVSSLDVGLRQCRTHDEVETSISPGASTNEHGLLLASVAYAQLLDERLAADHSPDTLYVFMSLQQ